MSLIGEKREYFAPSLVDAVDADADASSSLIAPPATY